MFKWLKSLSKTLILSANVLVVLAIFIAYASTRISPTEAPTLALFGIAYGLILLLNIGFIVFWLIVKKRFALISAIAILIGIGHLASYFQVFPSFASPSEDEKVVHVLSYNVKLFSWYNWRTNLEDRDLMIRGLELDAPEIMCFQEFFYNSGPEIFETRELLKKALDAPHLHEEYTNVLYRQQHYGIATLSKYPIVNKGVIHFPNERGNVCIYSDIVAHGDTIRVYNGHIASIRFNSDDYKFMEEMQNENGEEKPPLSEGLGIIKRLNLAYAKREAQVQQIMNHVNESPYPVIVCGDFNDTPVSYSYNLLASTLEDSFRESGWGIGSTYIGKFPSFRIDYIFHSPGMRAYDYHTLDEEVSDHHAISTKIGWH